MTDTKGNRCGIWPIQIGGWPKAACEWHDEAYTNRSVHQSRYTRKQIDDQFRLQLLEAAQKGRFRFGKRLVAHSFYLFARMFGGKYWEGQIY